MAKTRKTTKKKKKTQGRKKTTRSRKFRILSIDGGGIRGIIPGQIMVVFEEMLRKITGDKSARIADYFDLLAGTSTGGILTCGYLAPQRGGARPRFTAAEVVDLYMERGDEVFDLSLWQRIRSAGGIIDEKYSADGLEETLQDYFGDTKLSELLKPCLITAYDLRRRKAHFFRQHRAREADNADFYVRDVARATGAAPTYFEAARVKSFTQVPYPLIDGGVYANNPALCAYAEARTMPDNPTAKDMLILSLGTGQVKKPYPHKVAKDWGAIEWIKPVLDIMMSGVSETVDFQLGQIFDAAGSPDQYMRITPKLGAAKPDMDDASPDNLRDLRDAGQEAAQENQARLESLAKLLVASA